MQANLNRGMTRQRKGKGNAETSETVALMTIQVFAIFFFVWWLCCFFGWFKLINKINQSINKKKNKFLTLSRYCTAYR